MLKRGIVFIDLAANVAILLLAANPQGGEHLRDLLFACAVTVSVQLVGLYLVFATLIVPALATRGIRAGRLAACYALAAIGYAVGLVLSTLSDLPAGPLIVCALTALGIALFSVRPRSIQA